MSKVSRTSVKAEDVAARKAQREERKRTVWGWVIALGIVFFVFGVAGVGDEPAVDEPDPVVEEQVDSEARIEEAAGDDAAEPEPEDLSIEASVMCQEFVKDRLRAPATAGFPGPWDETVEIVNAERQRYRVFSHVDAENGFGAQIRTEYVCEIRNLQGDEWRLIDLQFAE